MIDELKLLSGKPVKIKGVGNIYPLTLNEIIDIDKERIDSMLSYTTVTMEDLDENTRNTKGLKIFDVIINTCVKDDTTEIGVLIIECLSTFLHEEVKVFNNGEYAFFYLGEEEEQRIINRENFEEIQDTIKNLMCLNKSDNEQEKPADEETRILQEKMKRNREKVEKAKGKSEDDEGLTISDLASILAAHGNNINILNVWDLTLYQLYNQFARMKMIEDYDISVKSLLAGASSDKIKLKHWMSKVKL